MGNNIFNNLDDSAAQYFIHLYSDREQNLENIAYDVLDLVFRKHETWIDEITSPEMTGEINDMLSDTGFNASSITPGSILETGNHTRIIVDLDSQNMSVIQVTIKERINYGRTVKIGNQHFDDVKTHEDFNRMVKYLAGLLEAVKSNTPSTKQ